LAGRILVLGVREDVPDLLAASDVLVLASSTEGSPAVVIEAGLLGLPVAAYAIGGVPEIVEDGRTGVLVPAGDRERLAAEVAALLVDPDRRAAMGAAGSARCRGAFEIGAVAPRYLEVYERVAGPRVGSASGAR
jgi:glycosyltransferase involved in cell wall biosynthesis